MLSSLTKKCLNHAKATEQYLVPFVMLYKAVSTLEFTGEKLNCLFTFYYAAVCCAVKGGSNFRAVEEILAFK